MAFLIDEAFLPATLTAPSMTDQQFAEFCSEHPDLSFETTAEGFLIVMPPNYTLTGARNSRIDFQLCGWAIQDKRGVANDSCTGYVLPNGARRSPDASWVSKSGIRGLSPESLQAYWRLCPDFVIELRSKFDRLDTLREKMREWMANGAKLGWLIDPDRRAVEIYRPGREPELLIGLESIAGEGPVEGFLLQLAPVWDPLAGVYCETRK